MRFSSHITSENNHYSGTKCSEQIGGPKYITSDFFHIVAFKDIKVMKVTKIDYFFIFPPESHFQCDKRHYLVWLTPEQTACLLRW